VGFSRASQTGLRGPTLAWGKKRRKTLDCWQISVQKKLLYPWGLLAVDESWVNMCITTRTPSKQIPGICFLQLGHLDVAGQVWDY
jgi:hypothetical protein